MTKASIQDEQFEHMLRRILGEEMPTMISRIIHEEVPAIVVSIIRNEVPSMIRQETADIREDIALIKQVQMNQSLPLNRVEGAMQATKGELRRLGVLFEDMDYRMQLIGESA